MNTVIGKQNEDRPNFLIIIGDDVGWNAFGCTGSKFAKTPHIDKLAKESLKFNRFYGCVAQCAPIRAELYTGLFPQHNGILANAKKIEVEGVKSIADHLTALNYNVGLTGKSHFKKIGKQMDKIQGFPTGANSSIAEYSLDGIKDYINKSLAENKNFCITIGSIHAHHPWDLGNQADFPLDKIDLPDHYIDTPSTRKSLAFHAAEVSLLDTQVGDVKKMLKNMGLEKNTILVFLSEQGIAMPRSKWAIYEYGNRSLCLMSWPNKIKARETDAIAQYCDIVPTFIDMAGGDPKNAKLDGISLKSVMLEGKNKHRKFGYLSNSHPFYQRAIIRDDLKLIWSPQQDAEHICSIFYKGGKFFSKPWKEWLEAAKDNTSALKKVNRVIHPKEFELYKIKNDIWEKTDLALSPENSSIVKELFQKMKEFMISMGEPEEPEFPESKDKNKKKGGKKDRRKK